MLKWMCAAAAAMALAAPAIAQKVDKPDAPAKQIGQFDVSAMKEGNSTLKLNGSCTAQYVVSTEGKAKNITTDCTHPEMGPYVVRTIETGTWEPEVFDHELFDTDPIRQVFNYGTGAPAVDPRGEKSPVMKAGVEPRDITAAIVKVRQEGVCEAKYTVGADGAPKDIVPNCTPAEYDELISKAISKMKFTPGEKDGAPTDWPGLSMPLKLTVPKH